MPADFMTGGYAALSALMHAVGLGSDGCSSTSAARNALAREILGVKPFVQVHRRDLGRDVVGRHHHLEPLRRRVGAHHLIRRGLRRRGRRFRRLQEDHGGIHLDLLDRFRGALGGLDGAEENPRVDRERDYLLAEAGLGLAP
jgi:hypothetical protein